MAKRLILHIGMHKTGSSAIQRFLSLNRWTLEKLDLLYPPSLGPDGVRQPKHNAIFSAISYEADHRATHPTLGPARDLVEATATQIEQSSATTAILSAEGFSGERPIFARALSVLADRFDVRVVVFLRRRDLWVESFYKQMVQSRDVAEVRPFHSFLRASSTRRHLDYLTILGWWADAFGDKSLRIVPFEAGAGAPVSLFLSAAGLSPRLALLPFAQGRVNISASVEATEIVRIANERGIAIDRPMLRRIEAGLSDKSSAFFTAKERVRLIDRFADDDTAIQRRFLCDQAGPLFAASPGSTSSRPQKWAGFEPGDSRLSMLASGDKPGRVH